jgi:hypothetical protein
MLRKRNECGEEPNQKRPRKKNPSGRHARFAAGVDGGEVENLHAGQLVDQALGVEPRVLAPDSPQVRAGALVAPVEETSQFLQLGGGLVHRQVIMRAEAARG